LKRKATAQCDKCRKNIRVRIKDKSVGELQYRYFSCWACGAVYVIDVTDEALRQEIKAYQELVKMQKGSDKLAKEVLQRNVDRSRELQKKYPLILSQEKY